MDQPNPWLNISAETYESHMSDPNVFQLQTLNRIMKSLIEDNSPNNMAILGVATGNGLEHVTNAKNLYAIDINENYLNVCKERFHFNKNISFLKLDIQNDIYNFGKIDLAICNLILEYLNEEVLIKKISEILLQSGVLSLVFQVNQNNDYLSKTKYSDVFSILNNIHHDIIEDDILKKIKINGFIKTKREEYILLNNKKLVRIDFKKISTHKNNLRNRIDKF